MQRILILAANPLDASRLLLDKEVREIENVLARAKQRERFDIRTHIAARPSDIQQAFLDYELQIVHFCGHGDGANGLIFEDDSGKGQLISSQALANLFKLFADQVKCVVLNACYSEVQAAAIVNYIDAVIGMNQPIGDWAAIRFSEGFYRGLGAGRDVEFSYKLGCNSLELQGIPEEHIPVLKLKGDRIKFDQIKDSGVLQDLNLSSGQSPIESHVLSSDKSNVATNELLAKHLFDDTLQVNCYSEFYVERTPLETICLDTLYQPGALVRIKAPSLMGKTLLMDYVLTQLESKGLKTVRISLEFADRQVHFSNLNRFLRWLCINITRVLALPNELDDYWDEAGMGSKVSCSTYVEEYLLAASNAPLVLCLDDVDLLFPYPEIYEDFFGLLRSWYEMARTRSRPLWKQLRLAIVHSTDVYIPLNINQSPFNVGVPIELTEFTPEQIEQFAQNHGLATSLDLTPLMAMVGGHPYLLEQAFDYLKAHPEESLHTLLAAAPTETGIYANHLREHWITLRDTPALMETLRQVVYAREPMVLESVQAHQLHSMGVIKLTGNIAEPRCQLYRRYFATQLGDG
ncbi:hypothetical protein N836_26540 [Leptolyngbya sp. Heron Island J]|uniref:AAA-like domain-containing protein n=1 Tax=Leptolyngbya sp. Heron Island J TaxID=1385935 RepID=UPI0003B970C7|nr:AAA-like domain-containing protein [Leptolyngbya sp. Heron Island J]ESA32152.1 hypothetical protein N836_26540 [Leptolyngbya sp. Heron Island J]